MTAEQLIEQLKEFSFLPEEETSNIYPLVPLIDEKDKIEMATLDTILSSDLPWSEKKQAYEKRQEIYKQNVAKHYPHLKNVKKVDEYGGEGKGEDYWIVLHFPEINVYLKGQ